MKINSRDQSVLKSVRMQLNRTGPTSWRTRLKYRDGRKNLCEYGPIAWRQEMIVEPNKGFCPNKATCRRKLGNQILKFCPEHAKEWDKLMDYAYIGFYLERFKDQIERRNRRNKRQRERRVKDRRSSVRQSNKSTTGSKSSR